MTIRERIQRAEAQRAQRNRQADQEWLERTYSRGWRPLADENGPVFDFSVMAGLVGALALLALAIRWVAT